MRSAWKSGEIASAIEKEQARRAEIAESLSPLKNLGNLAEAQARSAINELSDRIGRIHSETYLADSLQFQKASLEKKAGLVVRGQFSKNIRIDATLVANTSWLRGVLWAFIFALREEAVEQLGADLFPVLVLDVREARGLRDAGGPAFDHVGVDHDAQPAAAAQQVVAVRGGRPVAVATFAAGVAYDVRAARLKQHGLELLKPNLSGDANAVPAAVRSLVYPAQ